MSIHAPYNFVPLSAWIYKPEWGHLVSHDVPFSDGISGTLSIEIEARTPLLIGGVGKQRSKATDNAAGEVQFYQTPTGQYAIPGSSLKGMIRNVLEIATFGKMRNVDDRTLSVRDLTNGAKAIYRDHFTPNATLGKSGVLGGWLSLRQDKEGHIKWQLQQCNYLPVQHSVLFTYAQDQGITTPEQIEKNPATSADKYEAWGEANLAIRFAESYSVSSSGHRVVEVGSLYSIATTGAGTKTGTLVFTGQPDTKKCREFVFCEPEGDTQLLAEKLVQAFLQVHARNDSQDPQLKDTQRVWNYWHEKLRRGGAIPVFYVKHGDEIHSIGLAKMYRLPYTYSTAQTIAHTNPGHVDDGQDDFHPFDPEQDPSLDNGLYDLPELLLGTVHKRKTEYSLRSRVSFSAALFQGGAQVDTEIRAKELVLSNPKATYYPSYIHQPDAAGEKLVEEKSYRSYMDADAEIRGWKRYPTRPMWKKFEVKQVAGRHAPTSKKTKTILHPLAQGARFSSVVSVHNLRPVELGALAWALTWGDNLDLRHSLGMGKPYGLGQVSIRITAEDLDYVNPDKSGKPDAVSCQREFTKHMNTVWGQAVNRPDLTWEQSEQVKQLLAMADPGKAPGGCRKLEYMAIEPNEFQEAKGREQGDPHHVLEPYTHYSGHCDQALFPRLNEEKRRVLSAKLVLEGLTDQLDTNEEKALYMTFHENLFNRFGEYTGAGENHANDWCDNKLKLHKDKKKLVRLLAEQLKRFYETIGKWSAEGLKKKQKERIDRIKKMLGEQ